MNTTCLLPDDYSITSNGVSRVKSKQKNNIVAHERVLYQLQKSVGVERRSEHYLPAAEGLLDHLQRRFSGKIKAKEQYNNCYLERHSVTENNNIIYIGLDLVVVKIRVADRT